MEMTIDDAIKYYSNKNVVLTEEEAEANTIALNTMRKYQKIEEIVSNYGFDTSWLCLKKIREVMEDGNNNTDGKKLC